MREREIPEGVSDTVVCPGQIDNRQTDIIPDGLADITPRNTADITIYLEGGVIQDITNIPEGGKVTVVDWDTEGIEPNRLTTLEAGEALVTTWRGESVYQDKLIDLEKLKEYMNHRDRLECYILSNDRNANQTIIKPDADQETIMVFHEGTDTGREFKSLDDMAENHTLINIALECGAFYVYGYELGGC